MSKSIAWLAIGALVVAFGVPANAQLPVFVDEDFGGASDPLSYWYQDPAVSTDSFAFSDANDNMSGEARRGRSWSTAQVPNPDPPPDTVQEWTLHDGTAERAYIEFDASSYGDNDAYLDYTECFNFSIDINFSSFVAAANDEDMALGLWYTPEDAEAANESHSVMWPTRQHFVGVTISETGAVANLQILAGNAGSVGGRGLSADITGAASLQTDTDYRFVCHYRWALDADGKVGQLYGEVYKKEGENWVLEWSLPFEEIVYSDGNIHDTAWLDMVTADTANRRFEKSKHFGVSNWTQGTTQLAGPQFTSDNWLLYGCNPIPEPGTMALVVAGLLGLLIIRRKK